MDAKKLLMPVVTGLVILSIWTFIVEPQIEKQLANGAAS